MIVPGPVDPPMVGSVGPRSVVLTWDPPDDPNGMIIEYQVEYLPIQFQQNGNRRKRQLPQQNNVLECIAFLNSSAIITFEGILGNTTTVTLTELSSSLVKAS